MFFSLLGAVGRQDLTAARRFQMDANGRKFENRVVPWIAPKES